MPYKFYKGKISLGGIPVIERIYWDVRRALPDQRLLITGT